MEAIARKSTCFALALIVGLAVACATTAGAVSNSAAADPQDTAATEPAAPREKLTTPGGRERAVAGRLQLSLVRGEISWLETEAEKFLAIFRAAEREPKRGGIIINIPAGAIVDALPVHRSLARSVAAAGWAALSIQQAIPNAGGANLENDRIDPHAVARLDAAVGFMVSRGIENIVIVGDTGGAAAALQFIGEKASPALTGFVGLGAWAVPLDGTDVPVLDIAGTRDRRAIAYQKKRSAKSAMRTSPVETLVIDGAGPSFYGYEDLVAKRIRGWLERTAPGVSVKR